MQIRLPKITAEECIVVFLNIHSANIADHILDTDIYHEAFTYFVDEVERITEVLENEAAQIKEVCVESEEEAKMEEVEDILEGSNKDIYTGSQIFQQPPPTVSNAKKWSMNGLITWWIRKITN